MVEKQIATYNTYAFPLKQMKDFLKETGNMKINRESTVWKEYTMSQL